MSDGWSRALGVVVVAGGIALCSWLVFGQPHSWASGMWPVKLGIGLAGMGIIRGGVWLMFPDRGAERADAEHSDAGQPDERAAAPEDLRNAR
ncbi:hypothetical protein [Streptomyces sp. URMC 123]|uniref:hypothetical protein n=1 Tax=Streptomyces sp. URMC 123 TaxID=3423403 RepID=UPI003F52D699